MAGDKSDKKRNRDATSTSADTQDPKRQKNAEPDASAPAPADVAVAAEVANAEEKHKKEKKDKKEKKEKHVDEASEKEKEPAQEKDKKDKKEKKDKKNKDKSKGKNAAEGAEADADADGDADADAVDTEAAAAATVVPAGGENNIGEADASGEDGKSKKDKKKEKKERKERERLEREQAEKDAATVAAASAAQAMSALANAPRLPLTTTSNIDPLLQGETDSKAATSDATAPTTDSTVPAEAASADTGAAGTSAAVPEAGVDGEEGEDKKGKGKRGRPKKASDGAPKAPKASRAKYMKGEKGGVGDLERYRNLSKRELLVDRVFSSDTLKRLERELGFDYRKGRFTPEEDAILKEGVEEWKKMKNLSDSDFMDLMFNYKERKWVSEYTELWKFLTGKLEERANIAVRIHMKVKYSPFRSKGRYTAAEDNEIRYRMGELKESASSIAKRLGRLGQDVSSRWAKLQVSEELEQGPEFTNEEEDAVVASVEKQKLDHPNEPISWKQVALDAGNKRSYKVYASCYHRCRARVAKRAPEGGESKGRKGRPLGYKAPSRDEGWLPGTDELNLLQRLQFQGVTSESQVDWEHVSFPNWQFDPELLKTKFAEIKEKLLPPTWKGGWQETLDKLIKMYKKQSAKQEENADDEETEPLGNVRIDAGEETLSDVNMEAVAAEASLGDMPPPALDPAVTADADATASANASASANAGDTSATVPLDQQQVDAMLS